MKIRFVKLANLWYADVFGYTPSQLLMVDGADTFLDNRSFFGREITIEVSTIPFDGCEMFKRISHTKGGATYTNSKETFWLCNVVHGVLKEHPDTLYIKIDFYLPSL